MLTQAWPSQIGWPFAASIHYGLIGAVGLVFITLRGKLNRYTSQNFLAVGGAGVCLLVVPMVALVFAAGNVPESTSATVFCAVPLLTVLAASAFGEGEASRPRGLIVPSVAGIGGALLLFPANNPGSLRRWLFLVLIAGTCVVVATANIWMHRLLQGVGVAEAAAAIGVGCAAVLGVYGALVGWPVMGARLVADELLRGVALDLPEVWLLILLMREMPPARLSARFLLVPLVTVVEGYAVELGGFEWRPVLALGLLWAGGVLLLIKDEPEEVPGLRLR